MLCNYLPILFSCQMNPELKFYRGVRADAKTDGPKLRFDRVLRAGAKTNGEEEIRFQRILRENRDSEPSGLQELVWEDDAGVLDSDSDMDLDSYGFQRSRRQKEQRATQGGWGPMGKRSLEVFLTFNIIEGLLTFKIFEGLFNIQHPYELICPDNEIVNFTGK